MIYSPRFSQFFNPAAIGLKDVSGSNSIFVQTNGV